MSGTHQQPHHAGGAAAGSGAPATTVIVVGIDGSETSWDAFWWACGETRRLSGRAIAVFVGPTAAAGAAAVTAPFAGSSIACGVIEEAQREEVDLLRHQVDDYATDHDIDLTFVHAHGDTANQLIRVAEAAQADLIVVGRSTKARHHIAGSLGRRLTRRHRAPIIVVVP
jgi:nucleotide-binding universal stress UspA family protein